MPEQQLYVCEGRHFCTSMNCMYKYPIDKVCMTRYRDVYLSQHCSVFINDRSVLVDIVCVGSPIFSNPDEFVEYKINNPATKNIIFYRDAEDIPPVAITRDRWRPLSVGERSYVSPDANPVSIDTVSEPAYLEINNQDIITEEEMNEYPNIGLRGGIR